MKKITLKTDLNELKNYMFFIEFEKPLEYKDSKVLGYFSYHSATLRGKDVTNETRVYYKKLEELLHDNKQALGENKYLIVLQDYCIYIHDRLARRGTYKDIRGYYNKKPLLKKEHE